MAEPDIDQLRTAQGLAPLISHHPTQKPEPEQPITEDATIGNEERIRGIPAVGRVSGTIKGTRPGDPAQALELEQAGRDILNAHLKRHHYQPRQENP